MSEYRPLLEKAGERANPAPDAFEKLERRRARKQRSKRIATAVLAFAIAIGGSVGAFTAFRGSNGTGTSIGGTSTDHFYALWPEQTPADAQRAQYQVDSGDPSVQWRTDARETADRYVTSVLGWQQTLPIDASVANGSGPLEVTVSTPPPPCPMPSPGFTGPTDCGPQQATLTLERLVRQDATGVWSVTAVGSAFPSSDNALALPFVPGDTVVSGQEVSIPFAAPAGEQVQAAYAYIGACGLFSTSANVKVESDHISFSVGGSSFEESCSSNGTSESGSLSPGGADLNVAIDGYVFVFAAHGLDPSSGWDPIPAGEPLPQGASLVALAAVPVHFVPVPSPTPTGAAVPDMALVTCDGTTTDVITPQVAAQPDGVHISVTNTSSSDLSFQAQDPSQEVGGDAPVGTSEVVWQLASGTVELRCMDPNADAGTPGGYVRLTVVDPQGFYVPFDLQCASGQTVNGNFDFVQGAKGERGDPVDITKKNATGLLPTDTVEAAGYPQAPERMVRVVRDGNVVANFRYVDDGHGGWLQNSYNACTDAGIG